jgi:hypothetical protein
MAGVPGRLVLSAERIVSVSSWSWTIEATGPDMKSTGTLEGSGTSLGLLWSSDSHVPGNAIQAINPFGTPRIAFDAFVLPNLTLGGSVGYASTSGSVKATAGTQSAEATMPTSSAIVLAPRVGAAFSLSPWVTIWARGGITYSHCSVEQDAPKQGSNGNELVPIATLSWDEVAVSLDPMVVFTPISHLGVAIGPTFDIPISNSIDVTGVSSPNEIHFALSNYGVTGGILGYF